MFSHELCMIFSLSI